MKTEQHTHTLIVKASRPPTIEVDSEACAIYIRFRHARVARTIPRETPGMHLAVDVDDKGAVIGIEAIGFKEMSLEAFLERADVQAPNINLSQARIIPASLLAA